MTAPYHYLSHLRGLSRSECLARDKRALASRLIDTDTAAEWCGVSGSYLKKLRATGGGPRYVKLGRQVRYATSAIDDWLRAREFASTSDYAPNAS
jgi:predicted DNA-binding transcriptional regulator AlpA